MARTSRGHVVRAPVSRLHGVEGKAEYDITLCGECDQQVERDCNGEYRCVDHGRCSTVRFAVVDSCVLVLGDPVGGEHGGS